MTKRNHLDRGQGLHGQRLAFAGKRLKVFFALIALFAFCGAVVSPLKTMSEGQLLGAASQVWAEIKIEVFPPSPSPAISTYWYEGGSRPIYAHNLRNHPDLLESRALLFEQASKGAAIGTVIALVVVVLLWRFWRSSGDAVSMDKQIRGARLVSERALKRLARKGSDKRALKIGSIPWPNVLETRHMALIGSTGTGKTTALRQQLDGIESRGEPALVYDTSGEFVAHYYRPERGDIILNPFDARGAYWNPFDEIAHPADAERIAHQLLVEDHPGDESVWLDMARLVLANILRRLWQDGQTSLPDLIEALQSQSKPSLKKMLAGSAASRVFESDADRATASVLFMLPKASNVLQFLRAEPGEGGAFNFRDHFRTLDDQPSPKPWIFVPRQAEHFSALKPLLTCWLDVASRNILSLAPRNSRRFWLILDELADFGRVPELTNLLPQGRKFGAACILTFQSIGLMRQVYGRNSADALLGCTNTKLIFQLSDPDTCRWASDTIGKVEVETRPLSQALDHTRGGTLSLGTDRQLRPLILDSEFRLPRFTGLLLMPDNLPAARLAFADKHIRQRGPAMHGSFIPANTADTLWQMASTFAAKPQVKEGGPV
ncbi:MAG: type IV secretion system DNA-binding domain-containing protein [Pseudomonadota bacterium]